MSKKASFISRFFRNDRSQEDQGMPDQTQMAPASETVLHEDQPPPPIQPGAPPKPTSEADVPPIWQVGDTILDLYEVTGVLGEGGMGTVYKVRHKGWNIDLAVKSPKPEIFTQVNGMENFIHEAETWVNLGLHPHTVSCYYVRTLGGIPRVFAEYVEGGSLSDWIRTRKLYEGGKAKALERILDIAIQFAWGLDYAHEQGLVHQDVKPANVMMTEDGTAKVTDFGLAKARAMAGEVSLPGGTQSILVSSGGMTPAYCSPEQAAGQPLSRKTDIWSWGISVMGMFYGEPPCRYGQAAAEVLETYLEESVVELEVPIMPTELVRLLQQCFQKEQQDRQKDMLEIAAWLQAIYQQEIGRVYPRKMPEAVELRADELNNRAISLLDLGKQEEAMQAWEQALEADPQHQEATYNQGLVLWRSAKMTDEALLEKMREVSISHPGDWLPAYLTGLVHLERGDCAAAIEALQGIQEPYLQREEVLSALRWVTDGLPHSRRFLRTFEGHIGRVRSVCLSTDGRYALSGSSDKTLKLWDITSGRCLRTFKGHLDYVNSVCLSADGRFALSSSKDRTLKLWEVASGRCLRTITGYTGPVESVCLSADGHYALTANNDHTLHLWDVDSGYYLRTFEGHTNSVSSVCLSADGRYALSGSWDNTLKLWEVASGRCLRTFEGHTGPVFSVNLSADERWALSGSVDKTLRLWEVASGRCLRTFEGHTMGVDQVVGVNSVCLSVDGHYALSSGHDRTLRLWDTASGRCLRTFEGHTSAVVSVCLSADGHFALSGSWDGTLKLWDVRLAVNLPVTTYIISRVQAIREMLSSQAIYDQALSQARQALESGQTVEAAIHTRRARAQPGYSRAVGAMEMWQRLYRSWPRKSLNGGWQASVFEGHTSKVTSISSSADGHYALSSSWDGTLRLWDVASGRCQRTFVGHRHLVTSAYLSTNGRNALSGGIDGKINLWDTANGFCLHAFEWRTKSVTSIYLSADGRYALSGGDDDSIKLWDAISGHYLIAFEGHTGDVSSVCLSADGYYALSGSHDYTLKLWELVSGRCLRTFEGHTDMVWSVCLSANGRYALSGSLDHTLKLWELVSGRCIRTFEGHIGYVNSVCLSADRRYALSGSDDKTLKLWEVASGHCLRTFEGHMDGVTSVYLSTDGRYALSGSWDGTIKQWTLDWELEDRQPADWDEGARSHLHNFLTLHTPYAARLPEDRQPTKEEVTLALTRRGKPTWTEEDFQGLLYTLGCAGFGWLRPEGVSRELEKMARDWHGPPPLFGD